MIIGYFNVEFSINLCGISKTSDFKVRIESCNELVLKYEFGPNIDAAVWKLTTIRYQTSSWVCGFLPCLVQGSVASDPNDRHVS